MMKHHIRVVEPEIADGSIEYKRQINGGNPTRLRSLGTQMIFRLDEGQGQCLYQVGVEDDGCHSLLDYPAVAESCRILEHLARSLNAIVVERTMIQNEVICTTNNHQNYNTDHATYRAVDPAQRSLFVEPSILGDAQGNVSEWPQSPTLALYRQPGVLTRAQVRIQRIETHELDNHVSTLLLMKQHDSTKRLSLKQAARQHLMEAQNCHATMTDSPTAGVVASSSNRSNGVHTIPHSPEEHDRIPHSSSSPSSTIPTTQSSPRAVDNDNKRTIVSSPTKLRTRKKRGSNIGETLSNRNVRIAVMGNVDAGKSTLIGVS